MNNPVSILIVDDEALIAEDIRDICASIPGTICDTAFNAGQALNALDTFQPALVLLDINLSDEIDGTEIARRLEEWSIPYIFITSYSDEKTLAKVKQLKPLGYIVKPFIKHQITSSVSLAIDQIVKGKREKSIDNWLQNEKVSLTQREYAIVLYVLKGQNTKGISSFLGMSINTVKYHLKNIFVKFDVHSKAELIARYSNY